MSQDNLVTPNVYEYDDQFLAWEERDDSVPYFTHCIAGSIAGVTEHVSMLPFDTIKTNMQVAEGQNTATETVKRLYKSGGYFRFWKGASILASGCIPAHAVYFSVYEFSKLKLLPKCHDQNNQIHPYAYALTGALATAMHDLILTPFDMLKQRAQIAPTNITSFQKLIGYIIKNEGLLALYRGYPVTLLMNVPQAAAIVCVNETLKVLYRPKNGHNIFSYFSCAGIAGSIAALMTIPLDNIKTRLQTQTFFLDSRKNPEKIRTFNNFNKQPNKIGLLNIAGNLFSAKTNSFATIKEVSTVGDSKIKYHNIVSTIKTVLKEEGFRGFTKGTIPRILTQAPASAISWTTYEMVKKSLKSQKIH